MRIQVSKMDDGTWDFQIHAKNGSVIAVALCEYKSRRNALAAAKLIAGSKLKVVVDE